MLIHIFILPRIRIPHCLAKTLKKLFERPKSIGYNQNSYSDPSYSLSVIRFRTVSSPTILKDRKTVLMNVNTSSFSTD